MNRTAPTPALTRAPTPALTYTRAARNGFTMIEMVIVVAIIGIVGSVPLVLSQRLNESRVMLEDRAEADRRSDAAMRLWRADVGAALDVAIGTPLSGGGSRMEILRTIKDSAEPVTIVYEVSSEGALVRRVEDSAVPVAELCANVKDLQFAPVGRGYRAAWSVERSDGFRTWRREKTGFATPLIPLSVAENRP